jgi:hypothetical protein
MPPSGDAAAGIEEMAAERERVQAELDTRPPERRIV